MIKLFDLWQQSQEDRIKWFITQKIKEGKSTEEIRVLWDKIVEKETMKIVITA